RWDAASDRQATLAKIYRAEQAAMIPAHVIAGHIRMVMREDFDLAPILPMIGPPVLLLSPGASGLAPIDEQRSMAERIPDCTHVAFDGADHMIAFDQPTRCATEAATFIRQHASVSHDLHPEPLRIG